jgi:hypothetical protein
MSAPFVSSLRSRPGTLRLAAPGAPVITLRVQMAEVWDTVRVEVAPAEPVVTVKKAALAALYPEATTHEDFVLKLNGFEVLDENVPVADTGAKDGSTFLITFRRRRPVR